MRISNSSRSPILWFSLCLGILTHSAYSALDHEHYGEDTPSYLVPADNLLHGLGFVNTSHQPELSRTPGYPLLLAIFHIAPLSLEYLIFVQHVLCVFLIVSVAAVGLRIAGSRLVAFVAALFLSLDFATLRIANLLLTEIVATVLISLAAWTIYLAMTNPTGAGLASAASGVLGGCAALVRPAGLLYFVPLTICLMLALKRRALRHILIFVVSFLLLPTLWATRNFVETGYFGVSTVGSYNILYDRAAGTLAIQQPGDYFTNVSRIRGALMHQRCTDLESAYGRDCSQITEAAKASYYARTGVSIILANPLSFLRSVSLEFAYIVFGGGAEAVSRISSVSSRTARCIVLLFTVPAAFLALLGCRYWYQRDRSLCYVLALSIAYFLVISAVMVEAYSRLRVPVMPMYALLIGGGTAGIAELIQRVGTSRDTSANTIAIRS